MAKSYLKPTLATTHWKKTKKSKYNERILNVEHGTFTPLILSCFGGMGTEALRFYNRLGVKIAEKRDDYVIATINLIRTKLSFSLLRSALLCIRGSRSHKREGMHHEDHDVTLAVSQVNIL